MSAVTCRYCGLPFRVGRVKPGRDYFCCTGCSLLARVPVDGSGNFPVNEPVVTALTLAFLYFNQLLAWLVGLGLSREGKVLLAGRFFWIASAAAGIVWIALQIVQTRLGAARGKDYVVAVLSLGLFATAFQSTPPSGAWMATANALVLIWSARGVWRGRSRGEPAR